MLSELCKARKGGTHSKCTLVFEKKCVAASWKISTVFGVHLMNSCILHFSLYLWCSVGGYSSVYSSQRDGVFTILCIFIQREPLHHPVFMHVLALTGLKKF